ncbi:MAG: hypothetical protein WBD73_13805 [Candidatus Acidiferrales bacterium]
MSTATQEVATTWPVPDFLNRANRLRNELEAAIRVEQQKAQQVAGVQDTAFAKGLPTALVAGGAEKLQKLSDEKDAASLAVNQKREALRHFLNSERAGFFSLRDRAHERIRTEIAENFARMQMAATEICARLENLLGAAAEAEREEKLIRFWNREAQRFNRTIPAVNVNAITSAARIDLGESIRARIEGLLLQDKNTRELCREPLSREAQRRERAAATEEAREAQKEAYANPLKEF